MTGPKSAPASGRTPEATALAALAVPRTRPVRSLARGMEYRTGRRSVAATPRVTSSVNQAEGVNVGGVEMHEEDEDAGTAAERADELAWVRWQLVRMIEGRLVAPLSPTEQERYRKLAQREHELLEGRLLILDAAGGTKPAMEPSTARTGR
jgi:hypothetical protein